MFAFAGSHGLTQETEPGDREITLENLRRARQLLEEKGIDPKDIKMRDGQLVLPGSEDPGQAAGEPVEEPEPVVYEIPSLPADIPDPQKVPPYLLLIIAITGGVIGLGVGTFLVIFFVQKSRKRPPALAPLQPPLPEAIGRLNKVVSQLGQLDPVEVARQVSETLKRFTDRRFGVHFQEKTTEEIQQTADAWSRQLPASLTSAVTPFLERCDMIKFMGSSEIEMEKKQLVDEAVQLIERADREARQKEEAEAKAKKQARPAPKKRPATA